jgi:hypothetical protein
MLKLPSFWVAIFDSIRNYLPDPCRSLFNFVLVIFPLKLIMTFEGLAILDSIPAVTWARISAYFPYSTQDTPTFLEVIEAELSLSAKHWLQPLSDLEHKKFNKVPSRFNDTDVVLEKAFSWNAVTWKAHAWLRLLARRFVNEGPSLLAFLFYLSLPSEARDEVDLTTVVLPKNFDALGRSLFGKKGSRDMQEHEILAALEFAEKAIGRQPKTGYLIPPWHLQASASTGEKHDKRAPRLQTWATGIYHVTQYVRAAKSFQQLSFELHSVITSGNGFIVYQCDMSLDVVSQRLKLGRRGMCPRPLVAGPGMVPMALYLGFGHDPFAEELDESNVAVPLDDADTLDTDVRGKRRKKSIIKCTAGHHRKACGLCYMIAEFLATAPIMAVIAELYDEQLLTISHLYDELEYYMCEVRRLLFKPVARGVVSDCVFWTMAKDWINAKRKEMHVRL